VVSSLPFQSRSESGRSLVSPPHSHGTRSARGGWWSVVLTLVLVTTAAAGAQSAATGSFKGRRVSDVLAEFRAQGLNLVFSDALVPSSLRVTQEPQGTTPRDILSEILAPHGLAIREEARGALLVVKGSGSTAPQELPTPPQAPAPAPHGWIEGRVVDQATQRPVASAVVLVDTTGAYVITGEDGRFKIDSVPSGIQTIRAESTGYEPVVSPELKVSPGRAITVSIEMIASPQFREVVTVTAPSDARLSGVTTSSYGIVNEEIRRSAGSLGDINRFVQTLPGMAAIGDIRNDLVTRGGSPLENLIRVDGFETPTLSHFSTVGSTGGVVTLLNNELIADANFLAGGFPAEYGDRLSSVLDIRLREGNRTRHAFEADVNFAGASIVGEGPLGTGGSWIGSLRRSFVDLFANSAGIKSVPGMSAYTFKAVFDLGQRHKLWAVTFGGADRVDFNMDDDDPDEPDFVGIEQRGARVLLGVGWQHLLWARAFGVFSFSSSTAGYKIDMRDRQLAGDNLILRDHSSESATTIQYDVSWQASDAWSLRAGAAVKALGRDLDLAQPRGVETAYSVKPREDTPGLTLDFNATSTITAAYVQASARVLPRLTLNGGIRLETFEALGDAVEAGPRGGIEFRLSPKARLSLSAGRYHQHPELVTVVAVPQNANLAPIEADHLVAGVKYEPQPGLLISAEVYRKWYRAYPVSLQYPQLTLANHGSEFNTSDLLLLPMSSAGEGRARGLEFFLKQRLNGGVYGQIAYSLSRTEQAAVDGVVRRGSFDTPHVLTAVGGFQIGERWEVSGRFTVASGRPYTPPLVAESVEQNRLIYDVGRFNAERLPAFHRLDVRVDRMFRFFGRNASLFAEMQNLYNHRSVIEYSWNQKTRELYAERQLGFLPVIGINVEF
jgi:hypothetical protein